MKKWKQGRIHSRCNLLLDWQVVSLAKSTTTRLNPITGVYDGPHPILLIWLQLWSFSITWWKRILNVLFNSGPFLFMDWQNQKARPVCSATTKDSSRN
jgi:hypothetical protein